MRAAEGCVPEVYALPDLFPALCASGVNPRGSQGQLVSEGIGLERIKKAKLMSNDWIADLLTRIRNAQRAGHRSVHVRSFKAGRAILEVLKKEKFIEGFEEKKEEGCCFPVVEVVLKYYGPHDPVIKRLERISRSGRRIYKGRKELPRVARGLGMSIITTSCGVVSDREARKLKIGGEVIAIVA